MPGKVLYSTCSPACNGERVRPTGHGSQSSFENTRAMMLAAWACFASTNRSDHLAALAPAEGFAPCPPAVPSSPPQPPEEAGQRWGPAWPQTLFPVLCSAFGFSRLVQQRSLFRQAKQAHSTHMFFVFLTQSPKFTHFHTLKLISARVNHQDWQCPCSKNKHSIPECK